jgi:hypothetical protein
MSELVPTAAGVAWGVVGAAYAAACVWLGVRFFNRRERWIKGTAIALVLMPVLYTVSSGPMTIFAFRRHVTHVSTILPDGTTGIVACSETSCGNWFPAAYAPLLCASEQPWGEVVNWYWSLFPIRSARDLP